MVESSDPRRSGIVTLVQKHKTSMALPIGSMYGIPSLHLVDFYGTVNVGVYTSPMDPMGLKNHHLQQEIRLQMIHVPLVHCYLPCTKPRKEESTNHGKVSPFTLLLKAILVSSRNEQTGNKFE